MVVAGWLLWRSSSCPWLEVYGKFCKASRIEGNELHDHGWRRVRSAVMETHLADIDSAANGKLLIRSID